MKKQRDYRDEYDSFHASPQQKKRRAQRNAARNEAVADGRAKKGDGKEVHHVDAPRTGSLENVPTKVVGKTANRKIQPKRS